MTVSRTAARLTGLVVVVAVAWYIALITLAVRTANPPTLNARQILLSNLVVVGTMDDQGIVQVNKSYRGLPPEGELKVIREGKLLTSEMILPLTKDGDLYRVTRTELPGSADRLVYPANAETLSQLEEILRPAF